MIIDKIENFGLYPFGVVWNRIFEFFDTLTPESEDKKYTIEGDDIFAIVMSYQTSNPQAATFESHEKYIDIQTVITGQERFECTFSDKLDIIDHYDTKKDVTLYKRAESGQICVDVSKGTFVMLYPHDAHIAGLMVGTESQLVKKVVVKVKKELLKTIC